MGPRTLCALVLSLVMTDIALGQTQTYRPLGSWIDPQTEASLLWDRQVRAMSARSAPSLAPGARPQLAGLRPRSVELLEDSLLRKHPRLLKNSPERARLLLLRRYDNGVAQLRGYMAEAMFLDRNPEWGYVGKPNATQNDVYRWVEGRRTPFTGQIKYHDSGSPSTYAADMVKDYRAPRFFIPDDHVEATKAYLRGRAIRLEAGGDRAGAARAWRDYGRVRPIGATSAEIRAATTEAARGVMRERYAAYTSLGAALALSLGPTLIDMAKGDITANVAAYQAARSLSLIGVGIGTDQVLARVGQGALRGGFRGNVIVGAAITITQTIWLLHEHGWQRAFYQPEFYEEVVGGVSAVGLGMVGGAVATGLAVETGPWAPVIGFGAGVVTGTIGYLGGKSATRALIEVIAPEMLQRQERQRIESVKEAIDRSISACQTL